MEGSHAPWRRTWRSLALWLLVASGLLVAPCGVASASSTSVAAGSASATVSGSSAAEMNFPLERAGDLSYDAWLQYETQDGTAVAGADYEGVSGSMPIPVGATEASIPVQALGASGYSPDKQFTLRLGAVGVGPAPAFAAPQTFATGERPRSVASADIDGDGRQDLLVTNSQEETASVLLNTTEPGASTPSFAAQQAFAAGRGPGSAKSADMNGDGRPDLVITNSQFDEHAVSVLLNTTEPGASTPSLAARQIVATGDSPRQVTAADLNGDGRPDLMFSHTERALVSVLLNTTEPGEATLSFAPKQNFGTGQNSNSLKATDVNGDGRRDLIVATGADDCVSVLLNTMAPGASTPTFATHQCFGVEGVNPRSVATADVNGDGRPDLAVASVGIPWVSVLLNTTEPGAAVPSFSPQQPVPGLPSTVKESIAMADLNGDGRPDLIVAPLFSKTASVLFNTTPPGAERSSFSAPQDLDVAPNSVWIHVTDLNGDGRLDLILPEWSTSGVVSVLLNTTAAPAAAAPSFAAQQAFATGEAPSAIGTADLNGDGRPDLLAANQGEDTTSVLLNTTEPGASTPSFAAQQAFATGEAPSAIGTADLNGDGRPDLLAANQGEDTTSVLLNTTEPGASTPSFAAQQAFATGEAPSAIGTADLNGDGRPDLLAANQGEDTTSVLLNTTEPGASTPSFAAQQAFATGEAPSAIGTADLNGDGRPDLLAANQGEDTTSVLLNTTEPGASTPSFAAQQAFATGEAPSAIGTADLNGDGRPDLLAANQGEDTTSVLLNTTEPGASTPSFAAQQAFATGEAPSAIGTADLNGDGRPDLLAANQGEDTTSVLLNTTEPGASTPSFAAQQAFATGEAPSAIGTADLNGDGGPDLVAADAGTDDVAVLLDTQYAASISPATVTGTIHYAIPRVSLSLGTLSFGEQLAGSTTSKTETISNTGGAELDIEGIAIVGADAGHFSQTNSCPSALPVGSSCPVEVEYTPTGDGASNANLAVSSNSPTSPDTVALAGSGYTPSPPPPTPNPARSLSIGLVGSGEGTVRGSTGAISCPTACSHSYAAGTQVTLVATPTPGSTFAGWSGGGCSGAGACRITIDADTKLTADFRKTPRGARLRIMRVRLRVVRTRCAAKRASVPSSPVVRSCFQLKIVVPGMIVKGARGSVRVKVGVKLRGHRLRATKLAHIHRGRWRARLSLPGVSRKFRAAIYVTARFGGSPGFRGGYVRRRPKVVGRLHRRHHRAAQSSYRKPMR